MELIRRFLTKNPCWQANVQQADSRYVKFQKNGPKGLMLHSVGCAQPSARVFADRWDRADYSAACVHGFIDADTGAVWQTLPWNYRGWHGGGSSNDTHVGVEMCESRHIRYRTDKPWLFEVLDREKAAADAERTYRTAVELFAMLCRAWSLDPTTDICSHREGGQRGIASGHVDPEHYWSGLGLPYTMDGFRAEVRRTMAAAEALPFEDVPADAWYREDLRWGLDRGIVRGVDPSHFAPNRPCTRAEALAMLHRLEQSRGA